LDIQIPKTSLAVTAVHTPNEIMLFKRLLDEKKDGIYVIFNDRVIEQQ
jgi:hypothetical protein